MVRDGRPPLALHPKTRDEVVIGAERRRVQLGYFIDLGRGAYARLAQDLSAALKALFEELSRGFAELVRVLFALRGLSGQVPVLAPIDRHALALEARTAERDFPGTILVRGSNALQ